MKNILIIGGTSGIGGEIVNMMAKDYQLFVTGREKKGVPDASNIYYQNYDIKNDFPTDMLPEELHGVVYCPGTINLKPLNRYTEQDFADDYYINVIGAFKVIKACLPQLRKAKQSSVVFFSTVASNTGMPFHASIAAAKAGLQGLSISMAAEFATAGIRVNCIAPSLTDTPLASALLATPEKQAASAERHPLKKIGSKEELASLAVYLLSKNAAFITGQIIGVDGGIGSLKI